MGGGGPNQTKIKVPNPPLKVIKVPHKPKLRVCHCINKVTRLLWLSELYINLIKTCKFKSHVIIVIIFLYHYRLIFTLCNILNDSNFWFYYTNNFKERGHERQHSAFHSGIKSTLAVPKYFSTSSGNFRN